MCHVIYDDAPQHLCPPPAPPLFKIPDPAMERSHCFLHEYGVKSSGQRLPYIVLLPRYSANGMAFIGLPHPHSPPICWASFKRESSLTCILKCSYWMVLWWYIKVYHCHFIIDLNQSPISPHFSHRVGEHFRMPESHRELLVFLHMFFCAGLSSVSLTYSY